MNRFILTLTCKNRPGIVAAVATSLALYGGDIDEAHQFDDQETGNFFMRVAFSYAGDIPSLEEQFDNDVKHLDARWTLRNATQKRKVLILVSKLDHCMGDLLYRIRTGELNIECVGIVSNHDQSHLNFTIEDDIPFHHLPVSKETKREQELKIQSIIEQTGAELVVLARYMQVLSNELCEFLSGRCINIHHSFLPGFKGAKPYHQAYERGVKMIGATAHYATRNLDEGPIISQDVELITHADTPAVLVRKGRDIERRVLARAVSYHVQDRVLINGQKTVVFA